MPTGSKLLIAALTTVVALTGLVPTGSKLLIAALTTVAEVELS